MLIFRKYFIVSGCLLLCLAPKFSLAKGQEKDQAKAQVSALTAKITALEKEKNKVALALQNKDKEAQELKKQVQQLKTKEAKLGVDKTAVQDAEKNNLKKQIAVLRDTAAALEKEKAILEAAFNWQARYLRRPAAVGPQGENFDKIIHSNLGFAYGMQGRTKEAVAEYKKALQYDPQDKDNYFNLGYLLSQERRYKEAIAEYQKAIKGLPQDKEIYYNVAMIYANGLKDQKAADEYYQKFLKVSSGQAATSAADKKTTAGK
ncbi:MAG: tetratricopeptide repeat protein [Candidatus Omnitrophica bacterium]|nr:tetratricopeptide repeat protein [Candidatus Omnitrophota bacterium]